MVTSPPSQRFQKCAHLVSVVDVIDHKKGRHGMHRPMEVNEETVVEGRISHKKEIYKCCSRESTKG